jgi:hypothetical protein
MVLVVVTAGACGVDNTSDVAAAVHGPAFSISIGNQAVEASPLLPPRTVAITGYPHQPVIVALDRATAGVLDTSSLTLDADGHGSVTFTPCAGVANTCLGAATLSLSIGGPHATVASQSFTLVYPAQVGEVGPCQTDHNVMFLHGNDWIVNGTYQSAADAPWWVEAATDQVAFGVGVEGSLDHFGGRFSLYHLEQPLAPGIYDQAVRESRAMEGQPGIEVIGRSHGCNIIAGRFEVHDYSEDPVDGSVQATTISFEQACDPEPDFTGNPTVTLTAGCFHYQKPAMP